jgi:hypothetical protein
MVLYFKNTLMNQQLFIKSGEVAGMIGGMGYMVWRYDTDKSVVQEVICAIPMVILGGIIGKGVSELIATPTGMFLSGTFAVGVSCMVAKCYCLPSLKALECSPDNTTSSETQQCVVVAEQQQVYSDSPSYSVPSPQGY